MQLADILLRAAQGSIRTAAEHPQCSDFSPITSTPHGGLADHITALSFDKNKHLGNVYGALISQLIAITHNLVLTYFILFRSDSEICYFYVLLYNLQRKSGDYGETN